MTPRVLKARGRSLHYLSGVAVFFFAQTCGPSPPQEVFKIHALVWNRALLRSRRYILSELPLWARLPHVAWWLPSTLLGLVFGRPHGGLLSNPWGLGTQPEPRPWGYHG
jgi:hypothetical protein